MPFCELSSLRAQVLLYSISFACRKRLWKFLAKLPEQSYTMCNLMQNSIILLEYFWSDNYPVLTKLFLITKNTLYVHWVGKLSSNLKRGSKTQNIDLILFLIVCHFVFIEMFFIRKCSATWRSLSFAGMCLGEWAMQLASEAFLRHPATLQPFLSAIYYPTFLPKITVMITAWSTGNPVPRSMPPPTQSHSECIDVVIVGGLSSTLPLPWW